MSYTGLWGIDRNWSGWEHSIYKNSWLCPPIVWDVLMCKYITQQERTDGKLVHKHYLSWAISLFDKERGTSRCALLNDRINNSSIQYDRVLWELTNSSVFNAKDKLFVAECIEKFVENNMANNPEYADAEPIITRFQEIANDIRTLPRRVKFFVIHCSSCDDNVEWWFNRKRLSSWKKHVCEFTLIENRKVVGFSTNLEMCRNDKECSDRR